MSTIEDFENAPVGATATRKVTGRRAMKLDEWRWVTAWETYLTVEKMVQWGYTLDAPAPTTAREALDLAWELAHPVREGQVIPADTRYLMFFKDGLRAHVAQTDFKISAGSAPGIRTLEPLPDPEPEWLDAPAVMARLKTWIPGAAPTVFTRYEHDHSYWLAIDPPSHHWSELSDVVPLYPKERAGSVAPLYPKETDR